MEGAGRGAEDARASGGGATVEATLRFVVTTADTARAVGSGDLPVLGTPRLLAWCEAATCAALAASLTPGSTSVGTRVRLDHRQPSPVGGQVEVVARVVAGEGRERLFAVTARHLPNGPVVAEGEITRVVVDAARFLGRLPGA